MGSSTTDRRSRENLPHSRGSLPQLPLPLVDARIPLFEDLLRLPQSPGKRQHVA